MRRLLLLAIPVVVFGQAPEVSTDLGYRFLPSTRGDWKTYRSVDNLAEGPRLLNFAGALTPEKSRWLDAIRLSGANWGDPMNSLHLTMDKASLYRFTFAYRNMAYFNALPSFANPLNTFSQRSFDTRQRLWNADLDLRPGKRLQPFFSVNRQTGNGFGVSPIVVDENSYPAASTIDYGYTQFRGGVHFDTDRWRFTLEQGGGRFHDDTALSLDNRDTGNRLVPYLGRRLALDRATQAYAVTGENLYSSGEVTFSPWSWVDLTGQFFYSQPQSDVRFTDNAQGTLIWLETLRFVNGQQSLVTGYANQPRTSGAFHVEIRPWSRVRILESWQTVRTHNSGGVLGLTTLDRTALPGRSEADRLVWNQSEQQVQAFVDVTKFLTLQGGHRYLWGDAQVRSGTLSAGPALEAGLLRRHVGLAGFVLRPTSRLTVNANAEIGRGDRTYFRTSLQNYEQVRLRARYRISDAWQASVRYGRMDNGNPTPGVDLRFSSQQTGASVQWTRQAVSVTADYTRSTLWNDVQFVDPETYGLLRSLYRDNAHTAALAATWSLPKNRASLTLGGSLFRSAGSRPTRYYQPLVRLLVPVRKHVQLLGEWRQVSMGQAFYANEAFGVQQITVGLRMSR
jgi:hypothetical protein